MRVDSPEVVGEKSRVRFWPEIVVEEKMLGSVLEMI